MKSFTGPQGIMFTGFFMLYTGLLAVSIRLNTVQNTTWTKFFFNEFDAFTCLMTFMVELSCTF